MTKTMKNSLMSLAILPLIAFSGCGSSNNNDEETVETNLPVLDDAHGHAVTYAAVAKQRIILEESLDGTEGAQAPRDIDSITGGNAKETHTAPAFTEMNLCDIHFHISAEHKGGEFTAYAGNGDGEGYGTGYKYAGSLTDAEVATYEHDGSELYTNSHNPLESGDTFEVHYVYTSNLGETLGNSLGTCLVDGSAEYLRVETQVYVAVNDRDALDFNELTKVSGTGTESDLYQASNIPSNTGTAIEYAGSTTGAGYNEEVSPYQVTWNVRPKIAKVDIKTVGEWALDNEFDEDHAHNVRNLVMNPLLLSPFGSSDSTTSSDH